MREMKFDIDIILHNCERFGVKVEKGENLHGVTINGNPFDVTDVMDKAFDELSSIKRIKIPATNACVNGVIVPGKDGLKAKVSVGETDFEMKEQSCFYDMKAALYAA